MKVKVNQQETETNAPTLGALAAQLQLPARGVAIAVDNSMVPRTQWDGTPLTEGADIIIVKAFCGG